MEIVMEKVAQMSPHVTSARDKEPLLKWFSLDQECTPSNNRYARTVVEKERPYLKSQYARAVVDSKLSMPQRLLIYIYQLAFQTKTTSLLKAKAMSIQTTLQESLLLLCRFKRTHSIRELTTIFS